MAKSKLSLFCKSYSKDIYRAKRLADSIDRYNADRLPFFISVPQKDLKEFQRIFKGNSCIFLTDEEIIEKTCQVFGKIPAYFAPHLMQQLIKMEFWRIGLSENYAWIDSDSYFIKKFCLSDFMFDNDTPYTICQVYDPDEKRKKWENVSEKTRERRIEDGSCQVAKFKDLFNSTTENFDFGVSTPIIWSSSVLANFYENYLVPQKVGIFKMLSDFPCETFLYGYYLLHSNCIPFHPKPHMFKNFDYADEFIAAEMMGENEFSISKRYFGICIQSNWALFKTQKTLVERLNNRKRELMGFLSRLVR